MILQKYKGILFDFDGTLVDSWPAVYAAMRASFEYFNPDCDVSHIEQLKCNHLDYQASYRFVFKKEVDQSIIHFTEELYERTVVEDTKLFSGVERVLDFLKLNQLLWGIVTTKKKKFVHKIISNLDCFHACSVLICLEDVNNPKPNPEGLLKACQTLQAIPSEILYVGDSENDICAAKACRMDSVCATYGYIKDMNIAKTWAANYYITRIDELIQII